MDIRSFFTTQIGKRKTRTAAAFPKTKSLASGSYGNADKTLSNIFLAENSQIKVCSKIRKSLLNISDGDSSPPYEWASGGVPYKSLAEKFAAIESISGRLKSIEIMGDFYRQVIVSSPNDLIPIIFLTVNQIAPPHAGLEIGVGDGILYKVVELVTGRKTDRLQQEVKKTGDLAEVAEKFKSQQMVMFTHKPLTCAAVFKALRSLANVQGDKSRNTKVGIIRALLAPAEGCEVRFLVRSLQGKLRIGFSESSVLAALASVFSFQTSDAESILKQVYSQVPDWDIFVKALLIHGAKHLKEHCYLSPGVPIKVMLAKAAKGVDEVLERFSGHKFTSEYKYDGERMQIQFSKDKGFAFYSRNAEPMTGKYPDITSFLQQYMKKKEKISSFILDCEVLAYDRENTRILPFQTLMTRKRKEVLEQDIKVGVCLFLFDCLYFNEQPLLEKPLVYRRKVLYDNFEEVEGKLRFAQHSDTETAAEIEQIMEEAVSSNCEGIIVKTLEHMATYEPSKRSHFWLKLKKDYLNKLGDSFDLVPIGGYYGKGKRTGVFGAFLVACYDEDAEEFQAICKVGTGFSDEGLKEAAEFFASKENHTDTPSRLYRLPDQSESFPNVWFKAVQVWEVRCADLSISPKYFAARGLVDDTKGIALRFPRFVRVRGDKKPEDATTSRQVAEMYRRQFAGKN